MHLHSVVKNIDFVDAESYCLSWRVNQMKSVPFLGSKWDTS